MNRLSVDPNVVPLLQGLKPFLSSRSQVITDGILSVVQLLTSQHGQEAIQAVSKIFAAADKRDKKPTVQETGDGHVISPVNMAFTLFLILILLILSGNLLALNSHIHGASADYSEQTVPENSTLV